MAGFAVEDYGLAVSAGATRILFGRWVMTPMGNQRYLRGCGVFAVLDAISAKFVIQKLLANPTADPALPISLSKQEVLDCIVYHNALSYRLIYDYVIGHGVHREEVYPYEGLFDGDCRCSDFVGYPKIKVDTFYRITGQMVCLKLDHFPLTATMPFYQSFVDRGPSEDLYVPLPNEVSRRVGRHAVLVIGFGTRFVDGVRRNFFVVKNDWGLEWGLNGYTRVAAEVLSNFTLPGVVMDEGEDGA